MQDKTLFSRLDYRVQAAYGKKMRLEDWLFNEWHKEWDMLAALHRLNLEALSYPLSGEPRQTVSP